MTIQLSSMGEDLEEIRMPISVNLYGNEWTDVGRPNYECRGEVNPKILQK